MPKPSQANAFSTNLGRRAGVTRGAECRASGAAGAGLVLGRHAG